MGHARPGSRTHLIAARRAAIARAVAAAAPIALRTFKLGRCNDIGIGITPPCRRSEGRQGGGGGRRGSNDPAASIAPRLCAQAWSTPEALATWVAMASISGGDRQS